MATKIEKEVQAIKDMVFAKIQAYKINLNQFDGTVVARDKDLALIYPDNSLPEIVDLKTKIGIEVEVENAARFNDVNMGVWDLHDDPSLRNNGREFVTYPIWGKTIPRALTHLFADILRPGYDFSKRTSVHVHMNARNMTPSQVAAFTCLFIVFEKTLYRFVGNNRDKNIFCVPIQQTLISNALHLAMEQGFKNTKWYKYSGLNLLPLMTQGSIELRQLHGTDDIKLICDWINLLFRLRQYAVSQHIELILSEIKDLNTNSQYDMFLRKVFQEQTNLLDTQDISEEMESGVICVKESTLTNKFHQSMLVNLSLESNLVAPIILKIKEYLLLNGHSKVDIERFMGERRATGDDDFFEEVDLAEGLVPVEEPATTEQLIRNHIGTSRVNTGRIIPRFIVPTHNNLWTNEERVRITNSIDAAITYAPAEPF